jgi:hypothetical protein
MQGNALKQCIALAVFVLIPESSDGTRISSRITAQQKPFDRCTGEARSSAVRR